MKKLIALLLALVMVLGLAACTPANENSKPNNDTELTTVNVAYMANWGALWAVATADAKGYFAEEGIKLNLTVFEDGPTEIAAMKNGSMDVAYIGPGAHRLCSLGDAQVFLLQHLGDGDCIIGLNGVTKLEDLKGKKIGYAAGTSSETILTTALASVNLTMDDVEALAMDATALTTAALSGSVDAVAAWSPYSLTILKQAEGAVDICSNVDFPALVSPGSWVVNPEWAKNNEDLLVRFIRAMYKGMDYAAAATTDDAIAEEVAGYIAKVISSDAATVLGQRYDGSWKTSKEILDMLKDGSLVKVYGDQQATFVANGKLEGDILKPEDFVLTDLMEKAGK